MLWNSGLSRVRTMLLAASCLTGLALATGAIAEVTSRDQAPATTGRTIGLTMTGWRNALIESTEYTECGGSLDPGPVAQLRATPGALERIRTQGGSFEQTGPNGETAHNNPLLFNDPLPVPELLATQGYGVNLDGTTDGRATARTCAHQKFASVAGNMVPEGEPVDNQLSRVFGCIQGYRTGGQTAEFYNGEITAFPINRHLIEITGVDDEVNDAAVEVNIYKGYDRLVRNADGRFIAGLSQRIDTRYPQYVMHTTGRIVDGVLITDPIAEARFPHSSERHIGDRQMRDMTLRLRLTEDGAEGLLAGYDDWRQIWNYTSRRVTHELNKSSAPTLYRRLMQYADGYPDPQTGQCTHISSAYRVTAIRSRIVHPDGETVTADRR